MLTGIILTGGQGRSADGTPVWKLQAGGMSLIERQIETMRSVCDEVTVVTDDPRPLLKLLGSSVRIVTDFFPQAGPLGGLHAGLALARHDKAWVVGCDMPQLSKRSIDVLLGCKEPRYDAVIPSIGGAFYPLYGLYASKLADLAQEMLESGETTLPAFLQRIRWKEVPEAVFRREGCELNFITVVRNQEELDRQHFFDSCDCFHNRPSENEVSFTQQGKEG